MLVLSSRPARLCGSGLTMSVMTRRAATIWRGRAAGAQDVNVNGGRVMPATTLHPKSIPSRFQEEAHKRCWSHLEVLATREPSRQALLASPGGGGRNYGAVCLSPLQEDLGLERHVCFLPTIASQHPTIANGEFRRRQHSLPQSGRQDNGVPKSPPHSSENHRRSNTHLACRAEPASTHELRLASWGHLDGRKHTTILLWADAELEWIRPRTARW